MNEKKIHYKMEEFNCLTNECPKEIDIMICSAECQICKFNKETNKLEKYIICSFK